MPKPRKSQISLEATPYYHCISRCVRRAFLCGKDSQTGRSFEHRRGWIEHRLLALGQIFAVDIAAYAVMSNHIHLVVRLNKLAADQWSSLEVIQRWHQLFTGTALSKRALRGDKLSTFEQTILELMIANWRKRLCDLSWFMRCLNEPVARQANLEDGATGRFWEGRFKSQALLDEAALAACMAYVELNPVRAKIADTPENSDYTSIQRRVRCLKSAIGENSIVQPAELLPFVGNPREPAPDGLPFKLNDYLELVDWSGRIVREGKRGAIAANAPAILQRLAITPEILERLSRQFTSKSALCFSCAQIASANKKFFGLKRLRKAG
jgi:REP element-mobilizing transposase RayT